MIKKMKSMAIFFLVAFLINYASSESLQIQRLEDEVLNDIIRMQANELVSYLSKELSRKKNSRQFNQNAFGLTKGE